MAAAACRSKTRALGPAMPLPHAGPGLYGYNLRAQAGAIDNSRQSYKRDRLKTGIPGIK
jgi:hypothetical protein